MDVKLVDHGKEGELVITGRLETKNAAEAEALFLQIADRFENITLNMKDLSYISSAGLRVLKKLYMKVRKNGGELQTINANEYVKEVFEMTGFSGILNIK